MLDWYICECMVSNYNTNFGIKQPTQLASILILGGYHQKMRGSLYIRFITWDKYHLNIILILVYFYLGMKILGWYIDPTDITNESTLKNPYPSGIKKCTFLIYSQVVKENCDTYPTVEEINFVCKGGQCLVSSALLSKGLRNFIFLKL